MGLPKITKLLLFWDERAGSWAIRFEGEAAGYPVLHAKINKQYEFKSETHGTPLRFLGDGIHSNIQCFALFAICALKKSVVEYNELAHLPGWQRVKGVDSRQKRVIKLLENKTDEPHIELLERVPRSGLRIRLSAEQIVIADEPRLRQWLGLEKPPAGIPASSTQIPPGLLQRSEDIFQTHLWVERTLNVLYVSSTEEIRKKKVTDFQLWRCWMNAHVVPDNHYVRFEHTLLLNRHINKEKINSEVNGFGFLRDSQFDLLDLGSRLAAFKVSKIIDSRREMLSGGYYVHSQEDMLSESSVMRSPQEWFGFSPFYPTASLELWLSLPRSDCGDIKACSTFVPTLSLINHLVVLIAEGHSIEECVGPYGRRLNPEPWRQTSPPEDWPQRELSPVLPADFFGGEGTGRVCYHVRLKNPNPFCVYLFLWNLWPRK